MQRDDADRIYTRVTAQGIAHGADPFDLHILASIIAIAMQETLAEGGSLTDGLGLESWELRALLLDMAPGAISLIEGVTQRLSPPSDDESALRDILWFQVAETSGFAHALVRIVARRCQRPNHLWQDLGLGSRRELSALVWRHFPRLAERNVNDMKWKKFLYRMICSSSGFSLCVAPVCGECDEFDACFGAEDGLSLLARARRPAEVR